MPKLNQKKFRPTPEEARGTGSFQFANDKDARLDFVEQMMLKGESATKVTQSCVEQFGVAASTAKSYMTEVRDRWSEEERDNRPTYKTQAMRRIYGHIQKARESSNWAAVAQLERLLSDIQGTKEALEVQ